MTGLPVLHRPRAIASMHGRLAIILRGDPNLGSYVILESVHFHCGSLLTRVPDTKRLPCPPPSLIVSDSCCSCTTFSLKVRIQRASIYWLALLYFHNYIISLTAPSPLIPPPTLSPIPFTLYRYLAIWANVFPDHRMMFRMRKAGSQRTVLPHLRCLFSKL